MKNEKIKNSLYFKMGIDLNIQSVIKKIHKANEKNRLNIFNNIVFL